jgi:hypothetical protein
MSFNKIIVGGVELIPWLGGYTQTWDGEEIQFTGSSGVQVLVLPKRFGCEITVNDGRRRIYTQLLAMLEGQHPDGITVEDYINPDEGDVTIRRMFITDLKQVGSSVKIGTQSLSKGTTVKLIEVTRRYNL